MLLPKMDHQEENDVLIKVLSHMEYDQREMPLQTQLFLRLMTVTNQLPPKKQLLTTTTMPFLRRTPISLRQSLQQHLTMKFQLSLNSFHKLLCKLLPHQQFQNVLQKKLKKTLMLIMLLILITSQVQFLYDR